MKDVLLEVVDMVAQGVLWTVALLALIAVFMLCLSTVPLWIVPYLIWKFYRYK